MRPTFQRLLTALALAALPAAPALGTTYQDVADDVLVRQADVVAEVRVVDASSGMGSLVPVTRYRVEVERQIAGRPVGSTLEVAVPGGDRGDGYALKLWGVPEFGKDERALLFLRENPDGSYQILHLALGTFRRETVGGQAIAVRDLAEAEVLPAPGAAPIAGERDWARFGEWVAARARGESPVADYWVAVEGPRQMVEKATFFRWADSGKRMRWFDFDEGKNVAFLAHSAGQPGVPGGGFDDVAAALAAWTADRNTNIGYVYGGKTNATAADDPDGINVVDFNRSIDNVQPFVCGSGGTLAVGGPYFLTATRTYRDESFHPIVEGRVITNEGIHCFFANSPSPNAAAQELFGHEFGHTLGLGHSCGDSKSPACGVKGSELEDALMKASIHDDGRGARLNPDDRGGISSLYTPAGGGGGGGKVPKVPTGLKATALSSSSIKLDWNDTSNNELQFLVEQRQGAGGTFTQVAAVAANVKTATITGLLANTSYTFRVRASNAHGNSGYSNEATAKTQSDVPAAPANLRAEHVGGIVVLSWQDKSTNESLFGIEAKNPTTGKFNQIATAAANATSYQVSGLPTGLPHTFRVRALGAGKNSPYSNESSATVPGVGDCFAGPSSLCLGPGGRFQVQVTWRTQAGATGSGGAIPESSETGFFWFFDPNNVELAVKVLDGTTITGFYWTFYGALSNVEYWLVVSDRVTNESRTYHNPQGSVAGQAHTESLPPAATDAPLPAVPPVTCNLQAPRDEVTTPGTCTPSANTLCLLGGRFRVEVGFTTDHAGSGPATAVPFSGGDQSGRFWFFDPGNIELLVKVLDGRSVTGSFWVFYGALSNVEYSVTVTDTETGRVRVYDNPKNNFCGRADTAAFPG